MQSAKTLSAVPIELSSSGDLPAEFLILRKGWNDSEKGLLLFDDKAAKEVVGHYEKHGVDLTIDLEHDSLDERARQLRSDAGDARGWFNVEVRKGDLWGTGVTWTPDGARRLRDRTQRYPSPFVLFDRKTRRVLQLRNVALVSQPALYGVTPFVASANKGMQSMDLELVRSALAAIREEDTAKCVTILEEIIASAASGEDASSEPGSGEEPVSEVPDAEPPEQKDSVAASALLSALKVRTSAEALVEFNKLRAEFDAIKIKHEAQEAAERAGLVGELVKLGAELPATAWADPERLIPVPYLRSMDLVDLRARVEAFSASPLRVQPQVRPPTKEAKLMQLSDHERSLAEGLDPKLREQFIDLRLSRREGASQ